MKRYQGFTMIEILVVIVIIGVLASITTLNIRINLIKSRDTARKSDLNAIQKALELYQNDYGIYPVADDGKITNDESEPIDFGEPFVDSKGTIYMTELPSDPKANPEYCYQNNGGLSTNYQIYAKLENTKDRSCLVVGCVGGGTCNGNSTYNYGVSSSNISP